MIGKYSLWFVIWFDWLIDWLTDLLSLTFYFYICSLCPHIGVTVYSSRTSFTIFIYNFIFQLFHAPSAFLSLLFQYHSLTLGSQRRPHAPHSNVGPCCSCNSSLARTGRDSNIDLYGPVTLLTYCAWQYFWIFKARFVTSS